ncbi:MAG: RNA polymerase factor sigma-54 [Bacteroidales bacterium]|nr:RNA polymerase factor sigma-54 [Bacteroidales bacterium]
MELINEQRNVTTAAPQLVQIAKMIEATDDELAQLITAECEKNPVLEVDYATGGGEGGSEADSDAEKDGEGEVAADAPDESNGEPEGNDERVGEAERDSEDDNGSDRDDDDRRDVFANLRSEKSLTDDLMEQLGLLELTDEELYLARYLVNSLDNKGYLSSPIADLVEDLELNEMHETTVEELERVLTDIVQQLEPAGIAARDMRECLLLQLQEKRGTPASLLAYRIVDKAFDDYANKHYDRLCRQFGITNSELAAAQRVIHRLMPHPGLQESGIGQTADRTEHVRPAFYIHRSDEEEDKLVAGLCHGNLPEVRISGDYQQMLERIQQSGSRREDDQKAIRMIRDNMASAENFISALERRRTTLHNVIVALAALQRNFFLSYGDRNELRPMVLKDVADLTHYDASTISRVSNSKYIETDFGTIAVKELFSTGIQSEQGAISNEAVKDALREVIEQEDKHKPLSDDALSELLKAKGYPVARRTVAKYREQLGYPSARERKEI